MYNSPIELVVADVQHKIIESQENQVFQAVQKVGVNVDKEELIKALSYDRNQYQKGYNDGYEDGRWSMLNELKRMLEKKEFVGENQ